MDEEDEEIGERRDKRRRLFLSSSAIRLSTQTPIVPRPFGLAATRSVEMDSFDIPHYTNPHNDSRLLSEPSLSAASTASSSRTGPGGDDLSLSELSLSERPQSKAARRRPFSLLAQPRSPDESALDDDGYSEADVEGLDTTMTQEEAEKARRLTAKTREEKLQNDLFVLKKLNAAFEIYKDALRETKSGTDVSHRISVPAGIPLC